MRKNRVNKGFCLILSMLLAATVLGCSTSEKTEISSDSAISEESTENVSDSDGEVSDVSETSDVSDAEKESEEVIVLKEGFAKNNPGCRIGCAATFDELSDPKVFDIVTTHFDCVTFGNELKPDCLFGYSNSNCPGIEEGEVDGQVIEVPKMSFKRAENMLEKLYKWNEANPDNKVMVRGHVLVWHSQTPEWFFHEGYNKRNPYVDKDTMNLRLEWYIKTVLTHFTGPDSKYKDMFYGWDVVNEAVSDNTGSYRTDAENPNEMLERNTHNNNSSWWKVYGSNEYIINAFKYANKYAPESLELYYNDYNECNIKKQNGIVELLSAVKAEEGDPGVGTRINAMGMQGHYGMEDPNYTAVQWAIETYSAVGVDVQITEMDMTASSDYDGTEEAKIDEYEKQRKRYNLLNFAIQSAKSEPGVNFTGLTFWGTVDQYSWLQSRSDVGGGNKSGLPCVPLLFDENYEPKPCFYVFAGE